MSPDRKTIYIATDPGGLAEALAGGSTATMQNPGAILSFTCVGEGAAGPANRSDAAPRVSGISANGSAATGAPPQFTAEQAAAGKTSYNSNCAACHGNTMTNGTFAPPLAGEYFRNKWLGLTVRAFYDHARTMPPSAPASLSADTYADIVAYVLEVNGFKAGKAKLPAGGEALGKMTIR